MDMTRRSLLIGGAALAAASSAQGLSGMGGGVTAAEVVARIKEKVGIPWMTETVDRVVAGNAEVQVTRIATTMMATLDVIQRAVAAGNNMVITHEPTFYSHQDTTEALRTDPTFQFKSRFIEQHGVVVFRFHDHWHRMKPDGIHFGMTRELGWEKNVSTDTAWRFAFPETPLGEFVNAMATRLKAHSMRVVGDVRLPIRRVATSWGYASLMPDLIKVAANPDVDLIIVGETREWEMVEYVQDQIASGAKKALIVLNHVVSEQAGMKYCVDWLKAFVPEVPITFVAAREPFWVPRVAG
jgi:putative NIF3 family GTP cyclohydrolase 1 type 2